MDLDEAKASIYVWSPDTSESIGYCSISGKEIGSDSAALMIRIGEPSDLSTNGQNIILPIQQVSIHPDFIDSVEESLEDIEYSNIFTKTTDAVDTICVLCDEKITTGERIVMETKDSDGERKVQFHCGCKKEFLEMLDSAKEHIVANVI